MPPRKKRRGQSRKSQLAFREGPLEGPKHPYGSPQPAAVLPRHAPVKPIDHQTITSWVSPQFENTRGWLPVYQKQHQVPYNLRNLAKGSSRKLIKNRFPPLSFESSVSSSSEAALDNLSVVECPVQCPKDTARRSLIPVFSPQSCRDISSHELQNSGYMLIPPEIQTPEQTPVKDSGHIPTNHRQHMKKSCPLLMDPPESPDSEPVLVADTPEEKYGLKVTWRRRYRLLTYLREKGKLSMSQFLVKT
ncbi:RAD9, HUS1, RAD1-interacting nuclear orphan protein 1 [Dromiciops gliroides]|uniref:RAD9, HUS1, RAD1-interacting nuclear orphan protein 1 n=1 Tax=Dromiciops gliroides TaxID=33562 RepID=UPI001CC68099|nr:RAD9, HUS1, RAD1-interacting nuclear orphan protein 1 [Dromiciops gliroides]XP_043823304.1 RAD9, HUS1, RAD1-interacting nuclear orphan protein 1 [Dromiciops gliroides]XP_043823305.1 RAD9, HUS1, RAD1-interacting nuclear orphan protein 1 [Dromiciops gliroides]